MVEILACSPALCTCSFLARLESPAMAREASNDVRPLLVCLLSHIDFHQDDVWASGRVIVLDTAHALVTR